MYIKSRRKISAQDGDLVYGIFFGPYNYRDEPYISIATGDFWREKEKYGRQRALCYALETIAHELTHYFQWVNGFEMTSKGKERQATNYTYWIMLGYYDNVMKKSAMWKEILKDCGGKIEMYE